MIGKHKYINQRVRAAQKQGKNLNPKELASCTGKIRYDKKAAYGRAKEFNTMAAYRCRFCNHYHVGRKP